MLSRTDADVNVVYYPISMYKLSLQFSHDRAISLAIHCTATADNLSRECGN